MSESRIIVVVTGSQSEFGLLKPVMQAIDRHPRLELRVVVTGTHLLGPALTVKEVELEFDVHARISMQQSGESARCDNASALGRGICGFADYYSHNTPDVVLVLGDRIEAFAATAAATVAGIRVAHMHGGDRAEGIADEALRHAITKLAHIHLPATGISTERIICMGELPLRVHLVGSPAIDGLADIPPLPIYQYKEYGSPQIVFLLHPLGLDQDEEWANAESLLRLCQSRGSVLALHPNLDPGHEGILEAIGQSDCEQRAHFPRDQFVGLLRRIKCLVGNSSAGLIECAALGVPCINVGPRQAGREKPGNVLDVPDGDLGAVDLFLEEIENGRTVPNEHPYGEGKAGEKTADILATFNPEHHPLTKQNTY
ncbi:MAG: UDP-N-acetylglucosamine 2-epimerase (hydrolyzing) [Planctomycetes bacterium]|nr:UDP-N-acetylglucosamine 2-epimerase (hydrolyzing) [Planctomycetota bacterium]